MGSKHKINQDIGKKENNVCCLFNPSRKILQRNAKFIQECLNLSNLQTINFMMLNS